MANSTATFTLTLTDLDAKTMAKAIVAMAKLGLTPAVSSSAVPATPAVKKVFDETTCVKIEGVEKLSAALDPLRGPGMVERVRTAFAVDYSLASTVISAEAAARKNKVSYLFVVPGKADAISAIINQL